jgi:hypothetical protein
LEDDTQTGPDFRGFLDDIMAGHGGASRIWQPEGGKDPEEGALASAVRAKQAVEFAATDLKGDPVQGATLSEGLDQITDQDGVFRVAHETASFPWNPPKGKD